MDSFEADFEIVRRKEMSRKVNAEKLKTDRRIIARKLLSGEWSEKDLAHLLKKLPDVSENAETVTPQTEK